MNPTVLTDGTTVVNLPHDLLFEDEFLWAKITQSQEYAIQGALIIDEWVKQTGRPITLKGSEARGWVDKVTLDSLYSLVQPDKLLTLTLTDGRQFTCRFNATNGSPVRAFKLFQTVPHETSDLFYTEIQLVETQA